MFNKKNVIQYSLVVSTTLFIGVGSIVLGTSFDSWQQTIILEKLSKHENFKIQISELKILTSKGLNLSDPLENDANNFVNLLNVIFSGDKIIHGPMWIDWNYKLSKFMSLSHNREKYQNMKFSNCFDTLLTKPEVSNEIKLATKLIDPIKPIFDKFRLVRESPIGSIIGISFVSISAIPLTILFSLAIKNKFFYNEKKDYLE